MWLRRVGIVIPKRSFADDIREDLERAGNELEHLLRDDEHPDRVTRIIRGEPDK